MIQMLKKSGVAVILLLVLISLTVGSVSPANVISGKSGGVVFSERLMPGMIMPPMLYSDGNSADTASFVHADNGFTTVTLDMSGQEVVTVEHGLWHPMGNSDQQVVLAKPTIADRMDYIAGRMIVQIAGSSMPQAFPVKFFKHTNDGVMDRPSFDSYMANVAFMVNSDEHGSPTGFILSSPDGISPVNGSDNALFVFSGVINVTNATSPDVQQNDTSSPEYNNTITQGQTVYHQAQVASGQASMNIDLKWKNADDALSLSIYTPDGHILGPYTDTTDGKKDGRINIEVDNPSGVSGGTWSFKVTGANVTGKDEYYLRTW